MRAPLNSVTITSAGAFGIARSGSGLKDSQGVLRHIGADLRAAVRTPVYATEAGTINERYVGTAGIKVLGLAGSKWHRFLHLDSFAVALGSNVKQGQLIGYSGNTGNVAAHLHWDVRKPGTTWNASYGNYVNPMSLLTSQGEDMNQENAEKTVSRAYRYVTGKDPTPSQANYWVAELKKDSNIMDEFLDKLAEAGKDFQYKAHHYDEDLANSGGDNSVELKPGLYRVKKEL